MSRALQLNDMPPELLGNIFGYIKTPDIPGLKLAGSVANITPYESSYYMRSIVLSVTSDEVLSQPHVHGLAAAGLLDNTRSRGAL
jgi:hypothetical protein